MKIDVASATREQFTNYLARRPRNSGADLEYNIIKELSENFNFDHYDRLKQDLLTRPTLGSERKYLDLLYWTRSKLRIAIEQDLHRKPPLRLLDLGTGAGHFAFLCKRFGHQVMTLDLGHIELYNELTAFLGIERIDFEIRPQLPLPPFETKFDLVTGFMVGFNKRSKHELWGEAEWSFFLRDVVRNVMAPGGTLLLKMIGNRDLPGLHYDEPAFVSFIESHGGTVDPVNAYVRFDDLAALVSLPGGSDGERRQNAHG